MHIKANILFVWLLLRSKQVTINRPTMRRRLNKNGIHGSIRLECCLNKLLIVLLLDSAKILLLAFTDNVRPSRKCSEVREWEARDGRRMAG